MEETASRVAPESACAPLRIGRLHPEGKLVCCSAGNREIFIPAIPAGFLHVGNEICIGTSTSPVCEFLALQRATRHKARRLYFSRIGYVSQPKPDKRGEQFVRAEVPDSSLRIRWLHLPNPVVRDYFYFFNRRSGEEKPRSLYQLLGVAPTATFADLRLAYRVRRLELAARDAREELRSSERAFNLLSHPQLRSCYDALLRDPDAPALFPYGGFGQCLVAGEPAENGETFFVRRIFSYLPDQTQRAFRAPLRRIDCFNGYAAYRDSRRKVEAYLDPAVLPITWDPTWSQWRHLVGTKIGISGTFVEAGKYRRDRGEWRLVRWQAAVPSRLTIDVPSDAAEALKAARHAYERFGEHHDAIARVRARLQEEPLDESSIAELCHQLRIPSDFDIAQFCWKADYDPFFYQQLKKRAQSLFLFRDEYIFQLGRTVVAEVPQLGHATYVFAKPADMREFVRQYASTTRDHIRRNRGNVAAQLGFIGRIMHSSNPRRWLAELKNRIGEAVDYSLSVLS
jgi:curved DNA-binding protein CbpA